jgi:bifunctional non-homologous end joining protein LigD
VEWAEVERCLEKRDPKLLVFESGDVLKRVEEKGDLFEPVLELRQKLPALGAVEGREKREALSAAVKKPRAASSSRVPRKRAQR